MAGMIILAPKRICDMHVRNFSSPDQRFAGTSVGCTGEPDIGLPWFALVRFVTELLGTPAGGSCAYILNRNQQHQHDAATIGIMEAEIGRIVAVGGLPVGANAAAKAEHYAEFDRMLEFRSSLFKNDKATRTVATDANTALNAFRGTIKGNVLLLLEGHVTRNDKDPEAALHDFLMEGYRIYTGTAFNLKAQLMTCFRVTGVADTVEELQLLLATFSHHKALGTEVLHTGNPPALRDNAVADVRSREMLDMLLERMCSKASALSSYRGIVVDAIGKGKSYRYVLEHITTRIAADRPSLNHSGAAMASHLARTQTGRANHASLGTDSSSSSADGNSGGGGNGGGGSSDSTAQANAATADFMKGFVYGVDAESKRQKVDTRYGTDGHAGGQAGVDAYQHAEAGGRQPRTSRDTRACNYWDGTKCSRLEAEGTCPVAHYHIGTGSGGPGIANDVWQPRAANAANRLSIAGTNGGITNGLGHGHAGAAAAAANAYAAYITQQQQPPQQDPWATHHRQPGGGGGPRGPN